MTVPIHAPDIDSDLYLCYEIHGVADKYFNLVSDECTSVNAHYAQAPVAPSLNIIDSISIVAVDNKRECHHISVDVDGCLTRVDEETLKPLPKKRSTQNGMYEESGVSVRSYTSRVRISVPNCEDNKLVMWVICENKPLYDARNQLETVPIDTIRFEITRGLNLNEYSHGLLGKFSQKLILVPSLI